MKGNSLNKMKKIITLTESELVKVINRIVESHDDERYDDEDYVEVFLNYFRPWVAVAVMSLN